jgi:glutamate/tyrosine decarboxylase-like PLP-dependent enzyme
MMGVVCFRFIPPEPGANDELNSAIVEQVNASGRAYLNQTKLNGRTVMRIGLGNVLTTEAHLRNVWELVQKVAEEVAVPKGR